MYKIRHKITGEREKLVNVGTIDDARSVINAAVSVGYKRAMNASGLVVYNEIDADTVIQNGRAVVEYKPACILFKRNILQIEVKAI